MNLEDLLDEKGLQQDEWSLSRPTFGETGQLEVVGHNGKKKDRKFYIMKCSKCVLDSELFGQGYFQSRKADIIRGKIPCGCRRHNWSREQYTVLCKRKASELGYIFLGFKSVWAGNATKIKILCEKHGEWDTGSINSLLSSSHGCPACKAVIIQLNKTKPDAEMIQSFLLSKQFHPDTKFWRSDRKNVKGHAAYWFVSCPECGEQGESFSGDLQCGKRPCGCSKQRQKQGYINFLMDGETLVAIKFGIANNSDRRIKEQIRNNTLSIINKFVYLFPQCNFL